MAVLLSPDGDGAKKLKEIETMKKIICAAAAFAMVAGVATIASADGNVSLGGDARARWIYNDAGADDLVMDEAAESHAKFDSRVRLNIDAKTDAGAYAHMRLRFWDHTWGDMTDSSGAMKAASDNLYTDYAYLGFKTGNIDVSAGKKIASFTPWFFDDGRADRFMVKYSADGLMVAFTYDHKVETAGLNDDKGVFGVSYKQKYSDAVTAMVRAVYVDDGSVADKSGIKGSANVKMHFAGNNIILEQSWKESDTVGAADDHWGGYAEWNATFGALTPTARVGYTIDGFSADETFGWVMIGGDEPITKITRLGQGGDTLFGGLSAKYQAAEDLNMQANLVYMDIDNSTSVYGDNPLEISGQAVYSINKSTSLTGKLGWLSSDGVSDDAIGAYARMAVKF